MRATSDMHAFREFTPPQLRAIFDATFFTGDPPALPSAVMPCANGTRLGVYGTQSVMAAVALERDAPPATLPNGFLERTAAIGQTPGPTGGEKRTHPAVTVSVTVYCMGV